VAGLVPEGKRKLIWRGVA